MVISRIITIEFNVLNWGIGSSGVALRRVDSTSADHAMRKLRTVVNAVKLPGNGVERSAQVDCRRTSVGNGATTAGGSAAASGA
jgi:hypothetical protein